MVDLCLAAHHQQQDDIVNLRRGLRSLMANAITCRRCEARPCTTCRLRLAALKWLCLTGRASCRVGQRHFKNTTYRLARFSQECPRCTAKSRNSRALERVLRPEERGLCNMSCSANSARCTRATGHQAQSQLTVQTNLLTTRSAINS